MKTRLSTLAGLVVLLSISFQACQPNSEPDLYNSSFHNFTPLYDQVLDTSAVHFNWSSHPRPHYYRLFVKQKTNGQTDQLVLDTILYTEYYLGEFGHGDYVWNVLAVNNVSAGGSEERPFSVDTTIIPTFMKQMISLTSPIDSAVYKTADSIVLRWDPIETASGYEVIIMSPSFDQPEEVSYEGSLGLDTRLTNLNLDSGAYEWGVRAYRRSSAGKRNHTDYAIRKLFVVPSDTTSN